VFFRCEGRDAKYEIRGAKCEGRDTKYEKRDARCEEQGTKCEEGGALAPKNSCLITA